MEYGDTVTYRYDNTGALATVTDSATGYTTTYYYDFTNRLMKYVESGEGYSHSVGYEYDEINNLSALVEVINGVEHSTSYTYDDSQRLTSITNGDTVMSICYDDYGRVIEKEAEHGNAIFMNVEYAYREPTSGVTTTGQVESLYVYSSNFSRTYTYTYDANGNILSVSDGTNTTSYTYDTAGQLLWEYNEETKTAWNWTYDNAGNILTRTEYAYTDGTLGDVLATVNYGYNNANWGDLLTSYDGKNITYDEIGNPINDGNWAYTWEHGRQLASMNSEKTTLEFEYNADGLRTQKVVTTTSDHVHSFQDIVHQPKCTENGYTTHTCICGYIYQDSPVAATGHSYTASVIADTCTANGYTLYSCTCGDSYQEGAKGHTFTTLVVEPSETVNGFTLHQCECGYSYESDPVVSLASPNSNANVACNTKVYDYIYNGSSLTQLTITTNTYAIGTTVETLYFGNGTVTYNGEVFYYVTNLQGDVVAILDTTGAAVVTYTYDAWGNILSIGGSKAADLGVANPLTYRGYVYDAESQLYYLQSRYYNPEVGRFINADSLVSTGQGFLGNNMFAYCRNNPVSRRDASGTEDVSVEDFNENDNPLDDIGNPTGTGGGNGSKISAGQSSPSQNTGNGYNTGHPIGTGHAPKQGAPGSTYTQISSDGKGQTTSFTTYGEYHRPITRIDYAGRDHHVGLPHIHIFSWGYYNGGIRQTGEAVVPYIKE